ncbi:MAG TPA: hypothetical protein VM764_01535 [Gemmatimonadaceae bacterium]|nr:hypothetical protein [Gemmatimonadaceae bacterium]
MSLWDKFQKELDRAGDAAKGALDEGRLRIELFRVRQLADKAAEALGYAVHRARREGRDLDVEAMTRLDGALTRHDDEAARIEAEIAKLREAEGSGRDTATASATASTSDPAAAPAEPPASSSGPTGSGTNPPAA